METEKENKIVRIMSQVIKKQTGIELTASELWKLRIYYQDVRFRRGDIDCGGESRIGGYEPEARERFLIDFFDIDTHECGSAGLLNTEEFKEYCRGRVQSWRDERELI